jgi:hypothetical protein
MYACTAEHRVINQYTGVTSALSSPPNDELRHRQRTLTKNPRNSPIQYSKNLGILMSELETNLQKIQKATQVSGQVNIGFAFG